MTLTILVWFRRSQNAPKSKFPLGAYSAPQTHNCPLPQNPSPLSVPRASLLRLSGSNPLQSWQLMIDFKCRPIWSSHFSVSEMDSVMKGLMGQCPQNFGTRTAPENRWHWMTFNGHFTINSVFALVCLELYSKGGVHDTGLMQSCYSRKTCDACMHDGVAYFIRCLCNKYACLTGAGFCYAVFGCARW